MFAGENVTWTAADRNFLKVDRAIHDHGILVLEVLDHEDADNTDCYVGGCAINVQPYLRVMGRDNETSGSEMDSAISTAVSGLGHLAKVTHTHARFVCVVTQCRAAVGVHAFFYQCGFPHIIGAAKKHEVWRLSRPTKHLRKRALKTP